MNDPEECYAKWSKSYAEKIIYTAALVCLWDQNVEMETVELWISEVREGRVEGSAG